MTSGEIATEETASPVVVGVDGSDSSRRALRWAAREASLMHAPLVVVTAWTFPESPAPLGIPIHVPYQDELVEQAQGRLDQIVAEEVPTGDRDRVATKVIRGAAVPVLLTEASSGSLLVLGRQGEGLFERALVGSVPERCIRHALCPVVVVR